MNPNLLAVRSDRTGTVNTGAEEHQRFRRNLKKALGRSPNALGRIADKLVELAIAGTPWAIQEVANRLDGKPAQSVNLTNAQGTYVIMIPSATETAQAWEQSIVAEQHQAIATVPAAEPVAPPKADELP